MTDCDCDTNESGCDEHSECDERDHTCGCGECCDACWFDCCASREAIDVEVDMSKDLELEITNCGFVPQAQLDFLINRWNTPEWLAEIKAVDEQGGLDG